MATVLAGFLGSPGRSIPNTPQEYQEAKYLFEGEESPRIAKFFSVALRRFLSDKRSIPDRWLIMGTEKSIWDALFEVVPPAKRDEDFTRVQNEVSLALREGTVAGTEYEKLLKRWSAELTRVLNNKETICFLIGNAQSPLEQQKVWMALEKYVQQGDEIIFDITHSLRHFAVIATFSVMLLRQLRDVRKVDVYYGALELSKDGVSSVVHVPICQQLNEASEAIATYRHTGSFRPLGEAMKAVSPDITRITEQVGYSDETNHPKRNEARDLLSRLKTQDFSDHAIERALATPLKEALSWVESCNTFDAQLHHKAKEAFKNDQLFKAIAYLYEAITSASCRRYEKQNPGFAPPPSNVFAYFGYRKERFTRLKEANSYYEANIKLIDRSGRATVSEVLTCVELLRNAVMHGTPCTNRDVKQTVNRALENHLVFKHIFDEGSRIYDRVAKEEIPVEPCARR